MESKVLNFLDAMHLGSILSPYVHLPEDKETTTNEFVGRIVNEMAPLEYLRCIQVLSTTKITGNEPGMELLKLLHDGFEKNKVLSLVEYYRGTGME